MRREEETSTLKLRLFPSLALFFMGYIDWLTTIIGIVYFGTVELNPLFVDMTRTNLVAFAAVKLTTTIFVVLLFYLGDKLLQRIKNKGSKSFQCARITLRGGYLITATILLVTILNNLIVVANTI